MKQPKKCVILFVYKSAPFGQYPPVLKCFRGLWVDIVVKAGLIYQTSVS
jgi:hypothetical protein